MIYELEERTDSDELYKGFYKRPASDIHRVVMEIFEAGSAPKADPGSDTVRLAWARLSQAMEAANASSQHIMVAYSPVCGTPLGKFRTSDSHPTLPVRAPRADHTSVP